MFIHLHNHSHYSILEGLPKPGDYVKKALSLGMDSVAITDTGNVYGCHEFYKKAKDAGIKPILGAEIFVKSGLDEKLTHKLVLLSKSEIGYKNIIEIITKSNLSDKIISLEDIKYYSNDLFALSGNISGEIPYYILSGKSDEEIAERINYYNSIFGDKNFFLELLNHEDVPKQELVTGRLVELHNKFGFGVVATNNCYYVNKDDNLTQDVIQALGTGHEIDNHDRRTLKNGDYSFLSETEMNSIFGYIPSSLENTVKIASEVNIKIETGRTLIPVYNLPQKDKDIYDKAKKIEINETNLKNLSSDEWYLRYLCFSGMNERFKTTFNDDELFELVKKQDKPGLAQSLQDTEVNELRSISKVFYTDKKNTIIDKLDKLNKERIDRLEYELFVVHEMGFDAYFLIVADYIMWAKNHDIPVGPGRGSAAGAILAYLTGITDLDPLKFDLLFERFLNPARVSMPDIDTDFSDENRDEVINYCRGKYGDDRVVQICTFGTFAARAAVKDVGRVMGISFQEMNDLAKLIPEKPGTKLSQALEDSIEFKNAYNENEVYKNIIDNALKIEGNVRQIGVHACAVIIAPEKMTNFTALQHPPKDNKTVITQYSAYPLEDLGLLKMDFLGLRNLSIIKRTKKILKRNKNLEMDILGIDLSDKNVLNIFANGDTTGVFQFESEGMRMWLKSLRPTSFDDIIAMVALYRPGPMQFIQNYIDRKYGKEAIEYMYEDLSKEIENKYGKEVLDDERKKLFEDLGPFMNNTYGIAIYQEQLMRLVQAMAGFSLAEADMLRRGIGKKKKDVIEKLKIDFIEKSKTFRGYKPETSKTIYEKMIMPAADYSFNKSHAACYAFIAYQTAYLKAYYRTEFIVSMMVSDEEDLDRIALEVIESINSGISVLPPSVNESFKHFTYIDDKNIRFGLKATKGLGDGPIDKIIEIRNSLENKRFSCLEEFINLCGKEVINKKSLEALIKSGSLDDLGDRSTLLENIDEIIRYSKGNENKKNTLQIGLFEAFENSYEDKLVLKPGKPLHFEEKLFYEKEVLGFMVSGHPLDSLKKYCEKRSSNTKFLKMPFDEIKELYDREIDDDKKKKFLLEIREKLVKTVGVITDIRKILTKTGKNMVFLTCEGFDVDFELTIFDKDYGTIKDDLEIGKIAIIEGNLSIDFDYGKKTLQSRKTIIQPLTKIREQARDLGLFDNGKRGIFIKDDLDLKKDDLVLGKNILDNYIIKVPINAKKDDLYELKQFLEIEEKGKIQIFIDFKGQKIDTKQSIKKIDNILSWEKLKWQ